MAMALSTAFQERLEQMENARNHRLSLLQVEKELQANKSRMLALKLENIRSMERRCLMLEQEIASQNLKISALRSEIEGLDEKYQAHLHQLRDLKGEVEEMEEVEMEKERFYQVKGAEMKVFKESAENFVVDLRMKVNELKNRVNELKSTFIELQGHNGFLNNSEIAAAEMRKSELLATKAKLDETLAFNYQRRSQLQMQLRMREGSRPSSLKINV